MSPGLQLVLSAVIATAPAGCSWAHPGANPYRGDPVRALADFDMPPSTRAKLRALMAAHRYTDVATITRDDIAGAQSYTGLREMHSGSGQLCHGAVDRSAWAADRRERGLVYCADDACVIVPTICNNVSLVSRKPVKAATPDDDTPIDISPSAGPAPASADSPATPTPSAVPTQATPLLDFFPTPEGGAGSLPSPVGSGGGEVGGLPGGGYPGSPIGGGTGCCDVGPVGPTGPVGPGGAPGTPPVTTSPVPEAPVWALLLAGIALIASLKHRRR